VPSASRLSWIFLLVAVATVPTVVGTVPFGPQLMLSPFSSPAVVLLGLFVGLSGLTAVIALFNGTAQVRLHPVRD